MNNTKSNEDVPFKVWFNQLKRDIRIAKEESLNNDELIKSLESKGYNKGKGYVFVYPEIFLEIHGIK